MNSFLKGMLVGVGIGLLVAPMRGEEMRRLVGERLQEWRGYLPENEQLNQYVQQVSDRVSQASGNLSDLAQQAASKVKDTGSHLGNLAQQATATVKQTGQDVADTTKQTVKSAKQSGSTSTSSDFSSTYPETNPNL
ncbi:MAG: YtxH domain-containing protein [Chloroflexi bacterium]|nr:YtxH domain-containing protein [Chloroflexota bacterium]